MSVDIEAIGVEFDTTGLDRGTDAYNRNEQASKRTADSADKLIEKLQKQAATYNMTNAEVRRYEASQVKATAAQRAAIEAHLKQIEALERQAEAQKRAGESMFTSFLKAELVTETIKGVVSALGALYDRVVKGAADLDDFAERTGQSVEELSKMQQVAFISGQSFDNVVMAADRLSRGLSKADDETKGVGKALDYLNINARNTDGTLKNSGVLMREVAMALQQYEDGAGKAAIAQALFGRSGTALLPYLNDLAQAGEINANVTKEQASMAEEYEKQQRRTQLAVENYVRVLTLDLLPYVSATKIAFLEGAKALFGYQDQQGKVTDGSKLLIDIFRATAMGAARTVETFIMLYKGAMAVAGSFKAVWADIKLSAQNATPAQLAKNLVTGELFKQLEERNKVVAEANQRYVDLWNYNGSAISDAVAKAFDAEDLKREAKRLEAAYGGALDDISSTGRKKVAEFDASADKVDKGAKKIAKEMAEQNKLIAESAGLLPSFAEDWARLARMYDSGRISLDFLIEAQKKLLDKQPAMKKAAEERKEAQKAENKVLEEAQKAQQKLFDEVYKHVDKLDDEIEKTKLHNSEIGKTKEEVGQLEAARLEETAAQKERIATLMEDIDWSGELSKAYRAEAERLRELAALKRQGGALAQQVEEQKKQQEEYNKFVEGIDKTFHDGWMAMLQKGGDGWRDWLKSLKNSFKTLVADEIYKMFLKPIVLNFVQSIAGGLGGTLGSVASAASGASGLGNIGSLAGIAGSAGAFGSGVMSGLTAWGAEGSVMGVVGSAMNGSLFAGGIANGLGVLAGALGPIALGVMAIASIIKDRGGPKETSTFNYATQGTQGEGATAIAQMMKEQVANMGKAFGLALDNVNLGIHYAKDPQGTAQTQFDVTTYDGYSRGSRMGTTENVGRSDEEFQKAVAEETTRLVLHELQVGLQGLAGDFLRGVNLSAPLDEINSAITKALNYQNVTKFFELIGGGWSDLKSLGVEMVSTITQALGGYDAVTAQATKFYDLFFTEEEKRNAATAQMNSVFAQAGIVVPATREAYRALLQTQDLTTESGRATAKVLLENADAFATLHPVLQASASGVVGLSQGLLDAVTALRTPARSLEEVAQHIVAMENEADQLNIQLLESQGKYAEAAAYRRAEETAGMNEWELAIYDYQQGVREAIEAQNELNEARARELSVTQSLTDRTTQLQIELLRAQGKGSEADALQRTFDTKDMTDAQKAIYDYNVSLQKQIDGLGGATTAVRNFMDSLQERTGSLQVELLRSQNRGTEADALQRTIDTKDMTAAEIAVYDYNVSLQKLIDTNREAARQAEEQARQQEAVTKGLNTETARLNIELLRAKGLTDAAAEAQRALDTEGMTPAQIAIYDYNQSLKAQIDALQGVVPAVDGVSEALARLVSEQKSLEVQLLEAQGKTAEARAAQRALDIVGLTAAEVAQYDYNQSLKDQIQTALEAAQATRDQLAAEEALTQQRKNLEMQLLEAQGNTSAIRELQLAALDPSLHDLQKEIWATQDASKAAAEAEANRQKALQAAEQAAQEAEQKALAVARERAGIQKQIWELEGNTAALRQAELDALDPANRALMKQYYTLLDQKKASDEAAAAAQKLADSWASTTKAVEDQIRKLRGLDKATNDPLAMAANQARFALLVAAGKAGDVNAAKEAASLAEIISQQAAMTSHNFAEQQAVDLTLAASLENMRNYTQMYVTGANAGTAAAPGTGTTAPSQGALTQVLSQPVQGTNPASTVMQTAQQAQRVRDPSVSNALSSMASEINKLNTRLSDLLRRTVRTNEKWDRQGMPPERSTG